MNDLGSLIRTLKQIQPDYIFNLAAHANVRVSFDTSISVVQNNINSTLNLLEALRTLEMKPIFQQCSTSEVYGIVKKEDAPIKETHPTNPPNPYSVSKLTQEKLAYCYFKSFNIPVIITRAFSYINPRREDLFASSFAKQIVEIEKGKREKLHHGNLSSYRTLMNIEDMCEAYWIATKNCEFGQPYNIGGNIVVSVGEVLEILKSKAKIEIKTFQDPSLLRPIDIDFQIPDITKFKEKTGWVPKISLNDSLEELLKYYRKVV